MAGRVYQLKATIVGTKPPVWRRVLVEETVSLLDLHHILQGAFGWYDCHLHEFEIDGWVDPHGTWLRRVTVKLAAGQDVGLDLEEGARRGLLVEMAGRLSNCVRERDTVAPPPP